MKKFYFRSIGKGLMLAIFSLISVFAINAQCTYQIELADPGYGDGWNGGKVTVFVNGTAVLTDITLASGYGPEWHDFTVSTGDEITTDYTGGGWSYENNYKILDPGGNIQFETGYPNGTPIDLVSPGVTANCPVTGDILVTVTDAAGVPMPGIEVGVIDINTLYTDAAGQALFSGISIGTYTVYAYKPGVNYIEQEAEVYLGQTTNVDFVMAPPIMVINPLAIQETMNPNEYLTTFIGIQNIGDGDLYWTAVIEYPVNQINENYPKYGISKADIEYGTMANTMALDRSEAGDVVNGIEGVRVVGDVLETFTPAGNDPWGTAWDGEFIYLTNPWGNGNIIHQYNLDGSATGYTINANFGGSWIGDMACDGTVLYCCNVGGDNAIKVVDIATGNLLETVTGAWTVTSQRGLAYDEGNMEYYIGGWNSDNIWRTDNTGATIDQHAYDNVSGLTYHPQGGPDAAGALWVVSNTAADLVEELDPNLGWSSLQSFGIPFGAGFSGAGMDLNSDGNLWVVNQSTKKIYLVDTEEPLAGGWLTLDFYEGSVPANGGSMTVPTNLNATGTQAGEVYTADIIFTANPNVSETTVPVTMIIAGPELTPAEDLEAILVDQITGQVNLTWAFTMPSGLTFEYFLIRRNGAPIANTQNLFYTDFLPTYGVYDYTVAAVYVEGETVPAGPAQVIWFIPEMCWNPAAPENWQWVESEEQVELWVSNCGQGTLTFSFADYEDGNVPDGSFIVGVNPVNGQVSEGDSVKVILTYSSVGYGVGDWFEDLYVVTNELAPDDEHMIPNTMHVYVPGHLYGTVTDCNSGVPIGNVTVTAMGAETYTTETAENGTYDMLVDEDTYDVSFEQIGLQTVVVTDTFATQGVMTEVSVTMCEVPYPVGWVFLDPNEEDTQAMITWSLPMGPYEIIYDDGGANDYAMWIQAGGKSAVRFTPAGYPAKVRGGRIYVGDGSFPIGADFLGTDFAVGILDDDGLNGMPGTLLDSAVVTVNNYGWVTFGGFNRNFDDGDFYIVMWQLGTPPNAAPLGIDTDVPTVYRSYIAQAGTDWIVSPYQDFMMRATVSGPNQNVLMSVAPGTYIKPPKPIAKIYIATSEPSGVAGTVKGGTFRPILEPMDGDRNFENYRLRWHDGFDPDAGQGPDQGVWHHRKWLTANQFNDTQWGPRPDGFYAYSVQAIYESGDTSEWIYSNVAAHGLDNVVTITIEQCDDSVPDNVEVQLVGKNYPYQRLTGIATVDTATNQAVMVFDSVINGAYDLTVFKVGYQRYFHFDIQIFNDYSEFLVLQENAFPPRNLYVDALTSVATWDPALIEQLRMETFEDETFPPLGWQATTLGQGWFRSDDGGSENFPIPPGDGFYAVANDDLAGTGAEGDGSMDYLITPMMDMRQTGTYAMYFDHYFTAGFGQIATVEYSTDAGATWVELLMMTPVADWTPMMIDLAPLSGENGLSQVWFAFHSDDDGEWASGWAIDNVVVNNGPAPNLGYYVYLDDGFVAQTGVGYETYAYGDLVYGVTYKSSVKALYACGLSTPIHYTWTSTYLYPPRKLNNAYLYNTNEVPIYWFPPMTGNGIPMVANADYPRYDISKSNIEYGQVANSLAFNRSSAGDVETGGSGTRDYGDIFAEVTPQGIQPWGVAFDGDFLYVTDPFGSAGTVINQVNVDDGSLTGYTIDGNNGGPSWVGDMSSDGEFIYACNVGGDNAINVYDIATGDLVNTVTGAWTVTSQRGLGYDEFNMEYYIGGWNSNNIWRTDDVGATLDEFGFAGVSGLEWHPCGGPTGNGSLWVVENSSADLVTEVDPNAGWPTLQTFGIPSGAGFSGAGIDLNSDGMLWVVNQSNGVIYLVDVVEPCGDGDQGGVVPDGLIGFKVYQDGDWIADVPYNGEEVTDSIWYVINPLDPDCYIFDVSAIYDLGVYGFPGQEGESALEGPDTVCVIWGFGLPFLEDWNEGNFAFNGWRLDDENWKVNSQVGDPEPSSEFTWDPLLENDYSSTLTTNPLLADLLTEGDIFVDFNIKLADRNMTGEEKLLVEVTNDAGDSWQQVAEFDNANGSFGFADGFNHVNITNLAMGNVFQVRFNAVGQNSFDIVSWYVDNIHVYRMCAAPTELEGVYVWNNPNDADDWGAEVCWNAPDLPVPPALWIFWDTGVYTGGVGLTDGGTWSIAQRWDAGQLTDWNGEDLSNASITKMSFVLNDGGFSGITLKIWSGADASTLLYEQAVIDPLPGDWVEVTLDTPVDFDVNDELWIGYTIADQPGGMFPAGYDEGPAVPGYGDMITTNGTTWDRLSDFGIDNNWTVHAFAEELTTINSLPTLVDNTVYSGSGELIEGEPAEVVKAAPNTIERAFTGFNLYRQEVGVDNDYVLYEVVPYVEGQVAYCYYDKYPAVDAQKGYNYQVKANWIGDTDACESDPAWAKIIPTDDYVYIFVTDIGDSETSETSLYPNPATERVNVNSTHSMERITVINYVGQVVYDQELGGEKSVTLNTASYESGIYVVRIDTRDGVVIKRVVITD